jgi:hypothetical protein
MRQLILSMNRQCILKISFDVDLRSCLQTGNFDFHTFQDNSRLSSLRVPGSFQNRKRTLVIKGYNFLCFKLIGFLNQKTVGSIAVLLIFILQGPPQSGISFCKEHLWTMITLVMPHSWLIFYLLMHFIHLNFENPKSKSIGCIYASA